MTRHNRYLLLMSLTVLALLVANLCFGSVRLSAAEVWCALFDPQEASQQALLIVGQVRLPATLTALLAGAALGVSGLLMQTLFANPLADPSLLGVNTGASLGVALVMLLLGSGFVAGSYTLSGFALILSAAFAGAFAVMLLLLFCSAWLRSSIMLLIVGLMMSYLLGACISLLSYFSSSAGIQSFVVWGMGSFSGISRGQLPLFAAAMTLLLVLVFTQRKWLNALLMGEDYAINMGLNLRRTRTVLLLLIGLLSAAVTAFCGPITFLGLTAPHAMRLLFRSAHHHILLPATMLSGATLALLCHLLSQLALTGSVIPLNVITPLIGVPAVLLLIFKRQNR